MMDRLQSSLTLIIFSFFSVVTLSACTTTPPPQSVSVSLNAPQQAAAGPVSVSWTVSASNPTQTEFTTIYFDTEATPSALTASVTPDMVGYRYRLDDFTRGQFDLPDTFKSLLLPPARAEKIYVRAYARVNGQHFWSEEKSIDIK